MYGPGNHPTCFGGETPSWAEDFSPFAHSGAPGAPPASALPDQILQIIYTSGTTGRPKGAMRTHRAERVQDWVAAFISGDIAGANQLSETIKAQAFDMYVNYGGDDSTGPRYAAAPNTNVTGRRYAAMTCPTDTPNTPIGTITSHNYGVNYGNTTRVPTGSPASLISTAAFWSKRI